MISELSPTPGRVRHSGNLAATKFFAEVFQAYLECSNEVQESVREMVQVINAPDVTEDEYQAALSTVAEALFPSRHNGTIGIDLEECDQDAPPPVQTVLRQLDQEEATFAERLNALLEHKGMTQADLATAIGIGQPAVSMMLSRDCRPQRRTVEKIAAALKVSPEAIWPGIKGD